MSIISAVLMFVFAVPIYDGRYLLRDMSVMNGRVCQFVSAVDG